MTVTVYSAPLVIPQTAPPIPGGAIAIANRRILHVGTRAWVLRVLADRGEEVTETHWPGVIIPGLVNAHTHLQYTRMAEVGRGRYHGFDDWAAAFDAVYSLSTHNWAAAATDGAAQSIAYGVTALADVITDASAASALHDAELHGVAYWEVMNWANTTWRANGWASTEAQLGQIPETPGVGLSPHAPYSLDVEPLLDIPDLARSHGMRLHIHLGESASEADGRAGETDERWRDVDAESFRALRRDGFGASATDFVDQLGVLGPDTHIAHGVYLNPHDRAVLRARGTAVALCPRSNAVIGLDEPPVAAYLAEGNLIAAGTDSLSSSPSLDLLADLALLHDIATRQGYTERDLARRLLAAATLGGAHALGLTTGPTRVGQLQVGARADLAFVDVGVSSVDDTVQEIVTAGAGRNAATVISGELRWSGPAWTGPPVDASTANGDDSHKTNTNTPHTKAHK